MTQSVPPKAGPAGDMAVSITNPNSALGGIYAAISAFGNLMVAEDPINMFADPFEGAIVDITNRWTTSGSAPVTQTTGTLSVNPGALASATAAITSQPTFTFTGAISVGFVATIESTTATGNHRFLGFGTPPTPPGTAAAPLQDAIGFEIDTSGVMRASVYTQGVRTFTQVLTTPTDGLSHRYVVTVRGDIAMWFRDAFDLPLATTMTQPNTQILPVRFASLNSAAVVGTPTLAVIGIAVLDHGRNATQISDGTFPWRKAAVDAYGSLHVALEGLAGVDAPMRPDSLLRVAQDPSVLLADTFDAGLDTTDKWTLTGTVPTAAAGMLTVDAAATALAYSAIQSKPTFPLLGNMFNQVVALVKLDAAAKTGNYRFWGQGTAQASPTAAAPIVNGVGFDCDPTTGALAGSVWSAGTKIMTTPLTRPTDGLWHRYGVFYKTSRAYFEIDGVVAGSVGYPAPAVSNLPLLAMSVNGASLVSPTAVLLSTFLGVGDTSKNHTMISDGAMPWRKAAVTKYGGLASVPGPSLLPSYTAAAETSTGAFVANTRKDYLSIEHSAASTKTVRIRRITVGGYQTGAVAGFIYAKIYYGTAATSAGTVQAATKTNEASAVAEAVVKVLPTITAATLKVTQPVGTLTAAANVGVGPVTVYDATSGADQEPLTLRAGVLEAFSIALFSTGTNTILPSVCVYFTEE